MRPTKIADPSPNGFTLLELLVVLVVMGCILVALNQGLTFGLMAQSAQDRVATALSGYDPVARTIRNLVATMSPGAQDEPPPLVAGPRQLAFVSSLPDPIGPVAAGDIDATITVDRAQRLVLRWRPHLHAVRLRPASPAAEAELAEGLDRIEFTYWQPGSGWVSQWHGNALPGLVRIHFVFPAGDQRRWPDIVASPLLAPI